jgi:ATP-dependent RNA helicase SUPV3L1/SUV3
MARGSAPPPARAKGVTAVLGPTNTGKTHLAIERMIGHGGGVIGLPLRLLAREVYTRVVEKVGVEKVALVTGEEKIKPKDARYFVSTVEAMPRDVDAPFVAIDEIQLASDNDRGHVFTDALLNRRGIAETLVIGSGTMQPLVQQLLPGAAIVTRPRLSQLTFSGERKITRLPPRSAIVAFSAEEVYAIAELIRRQRGGAAVVMGALSPRTRNAQVELFQSGDVDHIVATDAIGMGLNLDIDHVAFAAHRKFDGQRHRLLTPSETAQIAGRAGRNMRDGSFGTTGRCEAFEPELVEKLENHQFEPVRSLNWRNPDLDFSSLRALQLSLAVNPHEPGLVRAPVADDEALFDLLATKPEIRERASDRSRIARLWDVCALPDFRKVGTHGHSELVGSIFGFLSDGGRLPDDWMMRQIALCDRIDGDLETIAGRVAQIRSWTYCANRADWMRDPSHWQGVTRAIEDKLSDALHEKLAARFVDRRTSVLMRRLRENAMLEAQVTAGGDVMVEGQHVGRLAGFQFTADSQQDESAEAKSLRAAAGKALAGEFEMRAQKLVASGDDQFVLAIDGALRWQGEVVARLAAGDKLLEPRVLLLADETLAAGAREQVETRLAAWLKAHVTKLLGPLQQLEAGEGVSGIGRGIAFRLAENLGIIERGMIAQDVKALDQNQRGELRKLGVRFGAFHIFTPALLKPAHRALAAQLFSLKQGGDGSGLDEIAHLSASGRTSFPADPKIAKELYRVAGFRVCGPRALRVDILERLADLIRPAIAFRAGVTPGEPPAGAWEGEGFTVTGPMTSLVGCAGEDFSALLKSLGYRSEKKPARTEPWPVIALQSKAPIIATAAVEAPVEAEAVASEGDAPSADDDSALAADAAAEEAPVAEASEAVAAQPVETAPADTVMAGAEAAEAAVTETVLAESTPVEAIEASPVETPVAEAAPAEPVLIDVWRPGRFERQDRPPRRDQQRPRHGQNREGQNRDGQRRDNAPGTAAADGQPRPPRPDRPDFRKDCKEGAEGEKPRFNRPQREGEKKGSEKGGANPRFDRTKDNRNRDDRRSDRPHGGKPDRRDGGGDRLYASSGPERDKRQADPASPFAALAALKSQLEKK